MPNQRFQSMTPEQKQRADNRIDVFEYIHTSIFAKFNRSGHDGERMIAAATLTQSVFECGCNDNATEIQMPVANNVSIERTDFANFSIDITKSTNLFDLPVLEVELADNNVPGSYPFSVSIDTNTGVLRITGIIANAGPIEFQYRVRTQAGWSNYAKITVLINAQLQLPVADNFFVGNPVSATQYNGTYANFYSAPVVFDLAQKTALNGYPILEVELNLASLQSGNVTLNQALTTYQYDFNTNSWSTAVNSPATDIFSYRVRTAQGWSNWATVTVNIFLQSAGV